MALVVEEAQQRCHWVVLRALMVNEIDGECKAFMTVSGSSFPFVVVEVAGRGGFFLFLKKMNVIA